MTHEEYLELGLAYVRKKEWQAASDILSECEERHRADSVFPPPAQLLSALGVSLAMAENKVVAGLDYCESAVKQEVFRPEFHYHLGLVHLKNGNKRDAIAAFYKGLKFNPSHPDIIAKLYQLGIRKRRAIGLLSRKNFLNKALGRAAGS